jgi:hypothetical protein
MNMKLESLKNKLFQIDNNQLSEIKGGREVMSSTSGTSGCGFDTADRTADPCGAHWDDICWYISNPCR